MESKEGGTALYCSDGDEDLFSAESLTDRSQGACAPKCSTLTRNTVYICLAITMVLVQAAVSVMLPVMAVEASKKGPDQSAWTRASVGLVFSISKFAEFIFAPVLVSELSNVGSTFLTVLTTLGIGGTLLIFGFVVYIRDWKTFLAVCYAIRIVQGILTVGNFVAVYALLVTILPDNLSFANGSIRGFAGFGYAVGPLIGGSLYDVGGFVLPFVVGSVLLFANGVLLIFVLPNVDMEAVSKRAASSEVKVLQTLKVAWIWVAMATLFSANFMSGALEPELALYFHRWFTTSATVTGLAFFLFGIVYACTGPSVGYIVDRGVVTIRVVQGMGLLLALLGALMSGPVYFLGWSRSLAVSFLAMIPLAIGESFIITMGGPDITVTLSESGFGTPHELRYVVAGLTRAPLALGKACGPVAGSVIVSLVTYPSGVALIGLLFLTLALVVFARGLISILIARCPCKMTAPRSVEGEELMESKPD